MAEVLISDVNLHAVVKADASNPAASAITARYAYDGFGRAVAVSGADADKNAFRFSTKQLDIETGMNYYGYRYYDSAAGRWVNRDPILEVGGRNIYVMLGNCGIQLVDVNGMCWNDFINALDDLGEWAKKLPKKADAAGFGHEQYPLPPFNPNGDTGGGYPTSGGYSPPLGPSQGGSPQTGSPGTGGFITFTAGSW